MQDGIPKFGKEKKAPPLRRPARVLQGKRKKGAPARAPRAGAPFFCAAKQKNLREKKGIFRGRPFAPGRGAWSFWRAKGAVAGCALPKGREKKPGAPRRGGGPHRGLAHRTGGPGAPRRGGGPHRPGGADCPAGPGAGGLRKRVREGGRQGGGGCAAAGKRPPPRGSAPQGRGGGAGRGAGEAGGRETGRKGGRRGPKALPGLWRKSGGRGFGVKHRGKGRKGGRVREKAPRGGQRPCPPAGGAKKGPRCARRAPGPLLPHGPKGGARREKGGRQRIRP